MSCLLFILLSIASFLFKSFLAFSNQPSTPSSLLFLQLGVIPALHNIKCRRILFLHYILTRDKQEMLYQFFKAMVRKPTSGDWIELFKKDLKDFEMTETFEQLAKYKKEELKIKVKESCKKFSLQVLVRDTKSKGSGEIYERLETQKYFLSDRIRPDQARLLFKIKSSMVRVKVNFKNMYYTEGDDSSLNCSVCSSQTETLEHAVSKCDMLPVRMDKPYGDLFSEEEEKWVAALKNFETVWRKREELLEARKTNQVDVIHPLSSCKYSEPLIQIVF